MMTLQQLIALDPKFFADKDIPPEDILQWLDATEAGWMHNGDPKRAHAELASGMCSNGFFFCRKMLRYPNLNRILAQQMVRKLAASGLDLKKVGGIVGSPYSAITFSYEVASILNVPHGVPEKNASDPKGKLMDWKEEFPAGTRILRIEELVTTGGSWDAVSQAIIAKNPHPVEFLPIVGVLVHRPPALPADYWSCRVVALVEKPVWAVKPEECSLCKQGSKRVKPKHTGPNSPNNNPFGTKK